MKRLGRVAPVLFAAIAALGVSPAPSTHHAIDVQHSKMTVFVNKQGLFSFLADNHEIDAPISAGAYDSASNSVDITVDASKMKVLDPKLSQDKRSSVQSNMTGPQVLDVAKYPTIVFRSTKIDASDPAHWKVTGNLTLHGETRSIDVQVTKVDATHFTGSTTIRQTAFGITPIKVAGGAVTVKDDVRIEFQVALGS
jgi:polyisoprenoid-binding protein YceI